MREIDLIPESYRRQRARIRDIRIFAATAGIALAASAAAWFGLRLATQKVENDIAALQAAQAISARQRDDLGRLTAERDGYARQLHLLSGLRSGAGVTELFRMIDGTLTGAVWFDGWRFRRAGVTDARGQPVEAGRLIVADGGPAAHEPWSVETHMVIEGQAIDHSALSDFVTRVLAQSEVVDVRIRRTELHRFATRSLVDFDLAVVINGRAGQ